MKIKKGTFIAYSLSLLVIGVMLAALLFSSGIGGIHFLTKSEYDNLAKYETRYKKMDKVLSYLEKNYYIDVDEDALLDSAYEGLVEGLDDVYSQYVSKDEWEEYLKDLEGTGTYFGVGITYISTPSEQGFLVSSVNSHGPAYQAGVRKNHIISTINGESALNYDGDTLRDNIRGEAGSTVTLGLIGPYGYYEVTLVRQEIPQESVYYEMLDNGLGYIEISSFIRATSADFKTALTAVEEAGATGLIIDLRGNGGGLVDQSLAIADMLMNKGTIINITYQGGTTSTRNASNGRTELPYVVLVNGYSASASEILCAGIKGNKEGTIIGTTTFGKGIMQGTWEVGDGSAVKYTVCEFFMPDGSKIHGVGIAPDIEVKLDESCYDEEGFLVNDVQLNKAIEVLLGE